MSIASEAYRAGQIEIRATVEAKLHRLQDMCDIIIERGNNEGSVHWRYGLEQLRSDIALDRAEINGWTAHA